METPQHKHDCDNCTFLGRFTNNDICPNYDLYYCPQGNIPTLIARWGEGPCYFSGMLAAKLEKDDEKSPLGECFRRAKNLNLI